MLAIYIEREMAKYRNEVEYTFECMLRTLGYEYKFISRLNQIRKQDVVLYYGLIEPNIAELRALALCGIMIYIPAEPEFFQADRMDPKDFAGCIRPVTLLHTIPLLTRRSFEAPLNVLMHEDLYYGIYNFDLLSNAFFHLAALDDHRSTSADSLHRIPDSADRFVEYAKIPYVNELFWMFEQFLIEAATQWGDVYLVKRTAWPQDEPYAIALSHSISRLQRWTVGGFLKGCVIDLLNIFYIRRFGREAYRKLLYLATNEEQYWNFSTVKNLEEKYQVRSTYFWGTKKRNKKEKNKLDVDYSLSDNDLAEIITDQCNTDHDVSLLASTAAYNNDVLENQKRELTGYVSHKQMGVRHPLRRSNPEKNLEYHNRYHFVYDSTVGFIEQSGFKHGIAFPYFQYIPNRPDAPKGMAEFRKNNCLQIPINLFDESLILSTVGRVSAAKAQELMCQLIEAVTPMQGLLCCDFGVHNFTEITYLEKLYNDLLEQITTQNAYVRPLKDITHWWKKRNAVVIKEKRHELEIYFPDDLEHFTLKVFGFPYFFQIIDTTTGESEQLRLFSPGEALSVENTKITIDGATIHFETVLADTRIRIKLGRKPEESHGRRTE